MNNRQFDRMDFSANVMFSYGGSSFTGIVENLSLKGLFVKTDHKVPLNESVGVTLSFNASKGNASLSLEGKVVRITDEGFGLNFRKISVNSLEQSISQKESCISDNCYYAGDLCQLAV